MYEKYKEEASLLSYLQREKSMITNLWMLLLLNGMFNKASGKVAYRIRSRIISSKSV